jgi:hypothetical protein
VHPSWLPLLQANTPAALCLGTTEHHHGGRTLPCCLHLHVRQTPHCWAMLHLPCCRSTPEPSPPATCQERVSGKARLLVNHRPCLCRRAASRRRIRTKPAPAFCTTPLCHPTIHPAYGVGCTKHTQLFVGPGMMALIAKGAGQDALNPLGGATPVTAVPPLTHPPIRPNTPTPTPTHAYTTHQQPRPSRAHSAGPRLLHLN